MSSWEPKRALKCPLGQQKCAKVPPWEPKHALKCPYFRPCPSKSLCVPLQTNILPSVRTVCVLSTGGFLRADVKFKPEAKLVTGSCCPSGLKRPALMKRKCVITPATQSSSIRAPQKLLTCVSMQLLHAMSVCEYQKGRLYHYSVQPPKSMHAQKVNYFKCESKDAKR